MTDLGSGFASNLTGTAFEMRVEKLCYSSGCGFHCPLALKIFQVMNFHFPLSSVNLVVQTHF